MEKLKLTKPLAFIDLETTGTNIVKDKIIEICILKIMPDGSEQIRTDRINPEIIIPDEVIAIHGITNEDVKNEPVFKDLAQDLYTYIADCDLAGYNSNRFDIPMLIEEFLRAGIDFSLKKRKLIDVQNIFHKMEPRTLKAAYKFYCQKDLINAHSAEADTVATYEILKAQIHKYQGREYADPEGNISFPIANDMNALSDFSYNKKNVDLVGHFVYNKAGLEVFNFGKHKNQSVEEVFQKEPSYYDWMMKSDFPLSTKNIATAIKLRGFNKSDVNINA